MYAHFLIDLVHSPVEDVWSAIWVLMGESNPTFGTSQSAQQIDYRNERRKISLNRATFTKRVTLGEVEAIVQKRQESSVPIAIG